MKIEVFQISGENCISYPAGKAILDKILPEIKAGNEIELDFASVKVFASPFFNMAIGTLFKHFKKDELSTKITFVNLSESGHVILKRVIENSEKYYSLPKSKQNAIDQTFENKEE